MADNASTARPYAKAVFELAHENNAYAIWGGSLKKLAAISQDADFAALVNDPKISEDQLTGLLKELLEGELPEGGDNFLNLLVKNDRISVLSDIEQQFEELVAKAQASVNAQVITALALTEAQKSSLASALEKRLGLKVNLEETVDADLVGGAIIKAGDLVIDGSAKGRIEKLTSALMR